MMICGRPVLAQSGRSHANSIQRRARPSFMSPLSACATRAMKRSGRRRLIGWPGFWTAWPGATDCRSGRHSRRAIVTPAAPPPAGTCSQANRSNGPLLFISGQTPRGADGQRLIGAPFEQQVRVALDNLEPIARGGLSLRNAVKVDVSLKDLADRAAFDAI
jgi:hypothetical protein